MSDFLPTADFDAPFTEGQAVDAPTVSPTDGERLMRFQRYRDERAFAQVVETHANMVWSVCSQILRHQQDVEDAFQATFMILARKSRSIRATESAAGWLYRVAYRTALLAHLRHRRRNEAPLLADIPSLDDQLTDIERNEQAMRLLDELNSLPARYQQPLVLCYMEGRTRSEAAEQLGVSTQTIKGLLARGTRLLRSRLIRRGVALSAALGIVQSTASSAPAATPGLASLTATLGMGFAVKSKIASVVIKGAPLKGVAACSLAEKGILAMTIAAASKPAVGVLGVCLAVGMLAVAEADPPQGRPGRGDGNMMIISTNVDGEAETKGATDEKAIADGAVALAAEVQTLTSNFVDVVTEVAVETTAPKATAIERVAPLAATAANIEAVSRAAAANSAVWSTPAAEADGWQSVAEPAPVVQEFKIARDVVYAHAKPNVSVSKFEASEMSPLAGGDGAALQLEGEYWVLKGEGLKKKAAALGMKANRARASLQVGQGGVTEADVLELESEAQLTQAEVKLCEMNALRVEESSQKAPLLQLGSKNGDVAELQKILNVKVPQTIKLANDGDFGLKTENALKEFQRMNGLKPSGKVDDETQARLGLVLKAPAANLFGTKNMRFEIEQVRKTIKEAELKVREAHEAEHEAVRAAAAARAKMDSEREQRTRLERKVREARPAEESPPAMEALAAIEVEPGVIKFKATPTTPGVVLTAPPAPAPPQLATAPPAPPLSKQLIPQISSNGQEFSVVPKDELKKLLAAAEKLEKLQQRIEELEKAQQAPLLDEVKEEGAVEADSAKE